jgi:hypothetical protein
VHHGTSHAEAGGPDQTFEIAMWLTVMCVGRPLP